MGFPLLDAENAAAALDILHSVQGVSLVLTDIAMPGALDGLGLAKTIRHDFPEIRVILMSGHAKTLDPDTLRDFPVLTKPFSDAELAQMISQVRDAAGDATSKDDG